MPSILIGNGVRIHLAVTSPIDGDTLTLILDPPDGSPQLDVTDDVATVAEHEEYEYVFEPDKTGKWRVRWEADLFAREDDFDITATALTPPGPITP